MLVIAHRGASADAPENRPEAFRLAESQGADGVELDVRQAPDGTLLVHHDPLPEPLPPEGVRPVDLTTALASMGPSTLVNVEIKNLASDGHSDPTMAMVDPVVATLRATPGHPQRWLVTSFSAATIDAVRATAPEVLTALLCLTPTTQTIERAAQRGHHGINPLVSSIDDELVAACHAAGLTVGAWTCDDPERIVELARCGVDAVITNAPATAGAALRAAGVERTTRPSWRQRWGTPG